MPAVTNVLISFRAQVAELAEPGDAEVCASLAGGVGTLRILRLIPQARGPLREAVSALVRAGARRLILDLRGNRGGDLRLAAEVASWFQPAGAPLLRIALPGAGLALRSGEAAPCALPLVVRVDTQTASAAEGLALALRGRARIEGGPSYGKRWGLWLRERAGALCPVPFAFG